MSADPSHLHRLRNPVRSYSWGSRRAIAALQGRPPSEAPEAELWLGAHPSAPSEIDVGGAWRPLDRAIADDPAGFLGPDPARRRGELPFLLKVLAAERPLSLQAHPDAEHAERGFAAEEERGVPRDARERNYPDPRHKPELIYALTPFTVLRGFRPPSEILERFTAAGLGDLAPLDALRRTGDEEAALHAFLRDYLALGEEDVRGALHRLEAGRPEEAGPSAEREWIGRLAEDYPGDRGVMAPLFLHLFRLEPGEAIYTGAGILHAYLEGVGVEVMAASDNVLRGALTAKHVDPDELLSVVRYAPQPPRPAASRRDGKERIFRTPATEFRLSEIRLGEEESWQIDGVLQILLAVEGDGKAAVKGRDPLPLARGDSYYVRPGGEPLSLRGPLRLFRATLGE